MHVLSSEVLPNKQTQRNRRWTTAAERETILRAYARSGLTQQAFAARAGIKYPTLISWLQNQRRCGKSPVSATANVPAPWHRPAVPAPGKVDFTEITLGAVPAPLEVRLPDGIAIRGNAAETIAELIRLLRC